MRDDDELSTRARGFAVEARVAVHLGARGLAVLATNVTIAGAELDLVARCEEPEPTIVFVEVRSRRDADRGHAVETIDAEKRRRIVRGATAWLVAHDLWERVAVRFDVVTVMDPGGAGECIEWWVAAFEGR
ncbi:MAG: YraN family protein [Deltaproteobacteria bacterium]|nr:YraN family protein [Deltaproteobacteria bacterium]MBK8713646.1 YraN family protein [Deltaproteobacteria bacterium]MBP7288881.1 YraN family protein [Nannocystaceae bacterium]